MSNKLLTVNRPKEQDIRIPYAIPGFSIFTLGNSDSEAC